MIRKKRKRKKFDSLPDKFFVFGHKVRFTVKLCKNSCTGLKVESQEALGCVAALKLHDPDIGSVADPGCLSRIPDPDFYPSLKKKVWAKFQRIMKLFTQKVVNKLSKI
jgi:hypothetical protein